MATCIYQRRTLCRAFGSDPFIAPLLQGAKYNHPNITQLLADYNVRSLELDVFEDPEGGALLSASQALASWAVRAGGASH